MMSYINTCNRAPERPARRKGTKIKWTYSQWARWDMSRSRPNSPIRPPTTYVWEDLRRSRSRGGYPWTHLDKEQLPNSINPEVILQGDDKLYRSLSSSPVPFDYPIHQRNRSNSLTSSDYAQELALSYTSSAPGPANGSLAASLTSDNYNMAENVSVLAMEEKDKVLNTDMEDEEQATKKLQATPSTDSQEAEQPLTVQEQVQAFIDDLPSEEELPEYLTAYLSQRTDDDSLPEHILEYLQQRVANLQDQELVARGEKEVNLEPPREEVPRDELPDFVKAYLSDRQDDDSLPEHILEYLKEEADKIQMRDEEELRLVDQTYKNLEKNQLSSYDDHYQNAGDSEDEKADQFDQFFTPKQPDVATEQEDIIDEGDEQLEQDGTEQAPEKKRKVDNLKDAMRSISEPAREKFNSLKRNVKKANEETMKRLKAPSFKRSESASPIRQRIGESFSRVGERMSSLTRGKKRSKSRMEKDVEDGYEPIAHPSAVPVPFQITTYESEDQVPRVYGLASTSTEEPELDLNLELQVADNEENLDNPEEQKQTPNKTKVSDMFNKGKDVWKNTTAKSKDAIKTTAAKSKDAFTVTATKSKNAINKSKVALQSTAAKGKEALKTTGEKLQTTMKRGKKKADDPKGQLEPQDSLEGTSSAIFDVESPVEDTHPSYDVPPVRVSVDGYDMPSFSCDVAYSTPKSNQLVRNLVLEQSDGSEDFNSYFPRSEETLGLEPNLEVDNCYNEDFSGDEAGKDSPYEPDTHMDERNAEDLEIQEPTYANEVNANVYVPEPTYSNEVGSFDLEPLQTAEMTRTKTERETIEKPVRKTKLPKPDNLNATVYNQELETVAVETLMATETNDLHIEPEAYENTEQTSNKENIVVPVEHNYIEEVATLSRPSRRPKKTSIQLETGDEYKNIDENKENAVQAIENQQSMRPVRTKKARTASNDSSEPKLGIDLILAPHYAVPKSFTVDIEAFNAQLEAAFQGRSQEYDVPIVNPNRPSRSRAKKTTSSSLNEPHYNNIPLRKKKSLSRDLPNIISLEIAAIDEAPTTLPRKNKQTPSKPNRSRSKNMQSESIVESITTIPRRKKKTSLSLSIQHENEIKSWEEKENDVQTFPRRKSKKTGIVKVPVVSLASENPSVEQQVLCSSEVRPELPTTVPEEFKATAPVELQAAVPQELQATVPEDLQTTVPEELPTAISVELPTTLPRRNKKSSRMSSTVREEPARNIEGETVVDQHVQSMDTVESHQELPTEVIEDPLPDLSFNQADYIASGDSVGADSSDTAERIQWIEITAPNGGVDDGYGYAVITKVGAEKKKKPPRPPPPVPEDEDEQYEYPVSLPPRSSLPDGYCTAPRRKKPAEPKTDRSHCTIRPQRPTRRSSVKEQRQSTPHPGDSDHMDELQSAEVVDRMNKRPLPPLPRTKKRQGKASSEGSSDHESAPEQPEFFENIPDAEQTARPKFCQLPTIVSTDGSLEEHESVQTSRLSFPLSDSAAPVVETLASESQSNLKRSDEMEDLRLLDDISAFVPVSDITNPAINLSQPARCPTIDSVDIEPLPTFNIFPQEEIVTRLEPITFTSSADAPVEKASCSEERPVVDIDNFYTVDEPSSCVSEYQDQTSEFVSQESAQLVDSMPYKVEVESPVTYTPRSSPPRPPLPVALRVDNEKAQRLNDMMNEVEENLEREVEKDIEDKIILLHSASTQNLTYTPIEEVSVSVQTEPSHEFEPLADLVRSAESPRETRSGSKNLEPIIQPVILNPEIRFPSSIPVLVPRIPPLQVDLPQRLRLTDLEVDRLTVGQLTVRSISAEELSTGILQATEIRCQTPLNVTVSVDPNTIQLQAPEFPPQQVVHIYERNDSPVPTRPTRRKESNYPPQDGTDSKDIESLESRPTYGSIGFSETPASFALLRSPDEPSTSREPTVRELAAQLAAASAREIGSMAASAIGSVSSASQLVLRNLIEGMWTQVNSYLENHGILLDSKQQESSKVVLVCLLILVIIVIFLGMGGPRGPRWEYYLPPN